MEVFYTTTLVVDTVSSHPPILSNHKHWYNNIGHHFLLQTTNFLTIVRSLLKTSIVTCINVTIDLLVRAFKIRFG